ncbi:rcc01693 family protein [Devosia aquimaris]|uniref:rcc01693 family protein n=1 Tax=Devosia aquimaris TaxID=2866214 RepID=UPI001CD1356F|nr:rcc01693 family protein [Devosia sp. CJK-A8-3]
MTPFPWTDAMRFGLGVLRLPPEQFWRMTPRELAAAWGALMGDRAWPLERRDLDGLMERFPDGR